MKYIKTILFLNFILYLQSAVALPREDNCYSFSVDNKKIKVWYYIPKKIQSNTKVVFVMHGVKRNGEDYRDAWLNYSKKGNFILVVPEFSENDFPGSRCYNLASIYSKKGVVNDKEKWNFSIIEKVFVDLKEKLKIRTEKYYLYGHSAGAQFVHRFVLFYPEASLEMAISANAGWYTTLDSKISFPYGAKNFKLDHAKIFKQKLLILLGSQDTDPNHKYLRKAKEAMLQGEHRLERGLHFYESAKSISKKKRTDFNWDMEQVGGVGHSNSGMVKEAVKYIK